MSTIGLGRHQSNSPNGVGAHSGLVLVEELRLSESAVIVSDLIARGHPTLVVARSLERHVEKLIGSNHEFRWLTTLNRPGAFDPVDLEKISRTVSDFLGGATGGMKPVVYLDGIEFLNTHNDAILVQKFVHSLRDRIIGFDGIFIVSISPEALPHKDVKALESEAVIIIPVVPDL